MAVATLLLIASVAITPAMPWHPAPVMLAAR